MATAARSKKAMRDLESRAGEAAELLKLLANDQRLIILCRLSDEELIETVRMLRQDRVAAASASENKRAAAAPVDTTPILDKLKNFSTKP